jgi:large subunit ribosomal protein L40
MSLFRLGSTVQKVLLEASRNVWPAGSKAISTYQGPLYFQVSQTLLAEPLKKKRKIDPAIVKAREERRRKRLEKQIRRLEKNAQQLKPIDECEVPNEIIKEEKLRQRKGSIEDRNLSNADILLLKKWAAYKYRMHLADALMIDRVVQSQQRALDELRLESEELYQSAIQLDEGLLPYACKGPTETPPIPAFDSPDGEYIDVSKNWDDIK